MALQGLSRESRRLGFKPASWAQWQDPKDVDTYGDFKPDPQFRVRFYAANEEQRAERRSDVDGIIQAWRDGRLTLLKAAGMLDFIQNQWRAEAEVMAGNDERSALMMELQAARAKNAALKR